MAQFIEDESEVVGEASEDEDEGGPPPLEDNFIDDDTDFVVDSQDVLAKRVLEEEDIDEEHLKRIRISLGLEEEEATQVNSLEDNRFELLRNNLNQIQAAYEESYLNEGKFSITFNAQKERFEVTENEEGFCNTTTSRHYREIDERIVNPFVDKYKLTKTKFGFCWKVKAAIVISSDRLDHQNLLKCPERFAALSLKEECLVFFFEFDRTLTIAELPGVLNLTMEKLFANKLRLKLFTLDFVNSFCLREVTEKFSLRDFYLNTLRTVDAESFSQDKLDCFAKQLCCTNEQQLLFHYNPRNVKARINCFPFRAHVRNGKLLTDNPSRDQRVKSAIKSVKAIEAQIKSPKCWFTKSFYLVLLFFVNDLFSFIPLQRTPQFEYKVYASILESYLLALIVGLVGETTTALGKLLLREKLVPHLKLARHKNLFWKVLMHAQSVIPDENEFENFLRLNGYEPDRFWNVLLSTLASQRGRNIAFYGPHNVGKSTLSHFLQNIFSGMSIQITSTRENNRFLWSSCAAKDLLIADDLLLSQFEALSADRSLLDGFSKFCDVKRENRRLISIGPIIATTNLDPQYHSDKWFVGGRYFVRNRLGTVCQTGNDIGGRFLFLPISKQHRYSFKELMFSMLDSYIIREQLATPDLLTLAESIHPSLKLVGTSFLLKNCIPYHDNRSEYESYIYWRTSFL